MADARLGILMLATRFPRPPGDIGNPATWPMPVRYAVVEEATVDRVVVREPDLARLLGPFVAAGARLVGEGARLITTSCGFLAPFQAALAEALPVPLVTSSLMQLPLVAASLPTGRRVGVLTVDATALTPAHLAAAGAPGDVPVEGIEDGDALAPAIRTDAPTLDLAAAERDVLAAGERLVAAHPEVGAVVLECTNMAPYAAALARRLALPVYDIVSLVRWAWGGLAPRAWPPGPAVTRLPEG